MVLKQGEPALKSVLPSILNKNGIIIVKCDTIYGLVCRPGPAETRVAAIKNRSDNKQFLWLIPDFTMLKQITDQIVPPRLKPFWPGPLTIIFNKRGGGTIALRMPDDPFLKQLMKLAGSPLVSTSVNKSGNPPMAGIQSIVREYESSVDCIVDDGDASDGLPSTLVDISGKPYKILRQGALEIPEEYLDSNEL
ncbi:MAG: Sua5/YciO/YrdC/YwlC family protein [Spirochaetales bacterium]|nr:Sua5/YciO/YrdC/YwlC family protein [Spirochaetales bacterium]